MAETDNIQKAKDGDVEVTLNLSGAKPIVTKLYKLDDVIATLLVMHPQCTVTVRRIHIDPSA